MGWPDGEFKDFAFPLKGGVNYDFEEPDLKPTDTYKDLAFQLKIGEDYNIWTYGLTEGPRRLTADDGDEWEPDWSPDAGSILYRAGGDRHGQGELRVVDPVSGEDQQFANTMILGHAPTWSPDGNRVAYDAKRPGSKAYQVFVFDRDTGQERQVTNCQTNCRFPNWSPDGTYLAYHSTLGVMNQTPQTIWKVRADGAEPPQVSCQRSGARTTGMDAGWRNHLRESEWPGDNDR